MKFSNAWEIARQEAWYTACDGTLVESWVEVQQEIWNATYRGVGRMVWLRVSRVTLDKFMIGCKLKNRHRHIGCE